MNRNKIEILIFKYTQKIHLLKVAYGNDCKQISELKTVVSDLKDLVALDKVKK